MRKLLAYVAALGFGLLVQTAAAAPRSSEIINRDWTFTLGDPAGAQVVLAPSLV